MGTFQPLKCPDCGGPLRFNERTGIASCAYCGLEVDLIDRHRVEIIDKSAAADLSAKAAVNAPSEGSSWLTYDYGAADDEDQQDSSAPVSDDDGDAAASTRGEKPAKSSSPVASVVLVLLFVAIVTLVLAASYSAQTSSSMPSSASSSASSSNSPSSTASSAQQSSSAASASQSSEVVVRDDKTTAGDVTKKGFTYTVPTGWTILSETDNRASYYISYWGTTVLFFTLPKIGSGETYTEGSLKMSLTERNGHLRAFTNLWDTTTYSKPHVNGYINVVVSDDLVGVLEIYSDPDTVKKNDESYRTIVQNLRLEGEAPASAYNASQTNPVQNVGSKEVKALTVGEDIPAGTYYCVATGEGSGTVKDTGRTIGYAEVKPASGRGHFGGKFYDWSFITIADGQRLELKSVKLFDVSQTEPVRFYNSYDSYGETRQFLVGYNIKPGRYSLEKSIIAASVDGYASLDYWIYDYAGFPSERELRQNIWNDEPLIVDLAEGQVLEVSDIYFEYLGE